LPFEPTAKLTITPDHIATGVADANAIAATLTASVPIPTLTLTLSPRDTFTPASTAVITATAVPTPISIQPSEPTMTDQKIPTTAVPFAPPPNSGSGVLKGFLSGDKNQKPLDGAAMILCLIIAEKKCRLEANLVISVNKDGSFQLTNVPSGRYVIFYNPSGDAVGNWKKIDGKELSLKLEGLSQLQSAARKELFSTFGGEGEISIAAGTQLEFSMTSDNVIVKGSGSITSVKYSLTMDFHEGEPISVEIVAGKVTEIDIQALAQ
jgi:hypothetical protein